MLFSAAGSLVAYGDGREVVIQDLTGRGTAQTISQPGTRLLAAQHGGKKVFLVDAEGRTMELCPEDSAVYQLHFPFQQGVQALAAAAAPGGKSMLAFLQGGFLSLAVGVMDTWSYLPHLQQVRSPLGLTVTSLTAPYAYLFPGIDLAFVVLVATGDFALHITGASLLEPTSGDPRRSLVLHQQRVTIPTHPEGRPLSLGFFSFLDPGFVYCVDSFALLNLDGQNSTSIQFPLPDGTAEGNRVVAACVARRGGQNPTDVLLTAHADGVLRAIDLGASKMAVVAHDIRKAWGLVCSQTVVHIYSETGEHRLPLQTVRARLVGRPAAPE